MHQRLHHSIKVAVCTAVTLLVGGAAQAALYPVAPPGSTVGLSIHNFIERVVEESSGLPPATNPVVGDGIYDHPGGFRTGTPEPGAYFVGLFGGLGRQPDFSSREFGVYLWETSALGASGELGPGIRLGYWDGVLFQAHGVLISALYNDTGVRAPDGFALNASFTPYSDFQVAGNPFLNAVRIEALDGQHNQVTAVAVTVPEPAGALLAATALAALLFRPRQRSVMARPGLQ